VNCAEFVELVTAFLDGDLPEDDEQGVTEHLTECDGCTTYLAQFRTTVDRLGHLPDESLPPEKRDALLTAFRKKTP
jgi:anti-sigma factor RsiW